MATDSPKGLSTQPSRAPEPYPKRKVLEVASTPEHDRQRIICEARRTPMAADGEKRNPARIQPLDTMTLCTTSPATPEGSGGVGSMEAGDGGAGRGRRTNVHDVLNGSLHCRDGLN